MDAHHFSQINCIFRFVCLGVEVEVCEMVGQKKGGRERGEGVMPRMWGQNSYWKRRCRKLYTIMFQREIILAVSIIPTPWNLLVWPLPLCSAGLTMHVSQGPDHWVFDGWRWLSTGGRLIVRGQTQTWKKSGQIFCLRLWPLLNPIKALLTHHIRLTGPSVLSFSVYLKKQWEAGLKIEIPKSFV